MGVLAPRQPEPPLGARAAGARALADFGGLIQGAWIGGFEVCDPVNGWVVRGGGDGFGGMASRGCGGEQGWIERFAVSGGRGGVQAGGGAGGEHRESGCEGYTVRVHCLQADGKLVGDGDELCWAGRGGRKVGALLAWDAGVNAVCFDRMTRNAGGGLACWALPGPGWRLRDDAGDGDGDLGDGDGLG